MNNMFINAGMSSDEDEYDSESDESSSDNQGLNMEINVMTS